MIRNGGWAVCVFMIGVVAISSAAAETPAEIATNIAAQIESRQKLEPAFEYLDWDTAFNAMDSGQRESLGIRSVKQFREYEVESYDGKDKKVRADLENTIAKLPPEQSRRLQEMNDHLVSSLEAQRAESAAAFEETKFTVGEETIEGETAKVALVKTRGEKVVNDVAEFVRVGGKWKLKSAAPFNPAAGSGEKNQLRSLLGPPVAAPSEGLVRPF